MDNWIQVMSDQLIITIEHVAILKWWVVGLTVIQVLHLIGYGIHKHK